VVRGDGVVDALADRPVGAVDESAQARDPR
jgi:hypothetical protein